MQNLRRPRGTNDFIGEDQRRHAHVVSVARRIAALYGFEEWQTPLFEETRVFARTLGETSDVVTKEMYTFADRGGDSMTLRPEGTAGICRALVQNGLTQSLPQRAFYAGPMFRYERPQAERYRQFHQIGAELIGPSEPLADAEVVACGWHILGALGIQDATVLEVNTLGDAGSRAAYRAALVEHLTGYGEALSEESRERLARNPLRVLDSKDPRDRPAADAAPTIEPYLTAPARAHWDAVRRLLDGFGVPWRENPRIVRGLDYYSHTAFEFVTDRLGAQGTVMGGGRYDGLVEEMGGPPTPAVGWAAGIERLASLLGSAPAAEAPVAVIPVGDAAEGAAVEAAQALRRAGVRAEMAYRGNLKRRMERANKAGSRAALILGEAEQARGVVQLRDFATGQQEELPLAAAVAKLATTTGHQAGEPGAPPGTVPETAPGTAPGTGPGPRVDAGEEEA